MDSSVEVQGLTKAYGDNKVLQGLSLHVRAGRVGAVLGPNGAGKTTMLRILGTLLAPDGGRATVAGYDVAARPEEVRRRLGVVGQAAAVDDVLDGRQNLRMWGRLHHLGRQAADRRADELLEQFGLADTGTKPVSSYSGGMRRRLDLAASLIARPQVLFLDEPTTGLDPRSRNEVWSAVRALVRDGMTVLLTTQYLEEADQLADHVWVVDRGRVVADGTPDALKDTLGADRLVVTVRRPDQLAEAVAIVTQATGRQTDVDPDRRSVTALVAQRASGIVSTLTGLEAAGVDLDDISLGRPSLDDVFLHLTGSPAAAPQPTVQA